jgi:hypothetical protein
MTVDRRRRGYLAGRADVEGLRPRGLEGGSQRETSERGDDRDDGRERAPTEFESALGSQVEPRVERQILRLQREDPLVKTGGFPLRGAERIVYYGSWTVPCRRANICRAASCPTQPTWTDAHSCFTSGLRPEGQFVVRGARTPGRGR